jgi:diaminopimelate decarboxylase
LNASDSRFRLSESQAESLARQFGTPLYVVDEATFRSKISTYRDSFAEAYPGSEISYASKANSTLAILKIAFSEGATIDVASEGELRAALQAGIPANACHLHGNNKQISELEFAHEQGISHVVIDHLGEVQMIGQLRKGRAYATRYILRLAPGVDPKTHASISTGQADTKFGFNIANGAAEEAVLKCLENGLPLDGIHCHVGSQLKQKYGYETNYLNVGGGLGARYLQNDEPMAPGEYCKAIVAAILPILSKADLSPKLAQEPGRSLIAEAGVTLYTVGVVKTVPISATETRTYVATDGGLSDNPRPALYQSKYAVERVYQNEKNWEYVTDGPGAVVVGNIVGSTEKMKTVTVSGKHCETDTLFRDVDLPSDIASGDLIQVLTTGAYNASMANNYNRYPRPGSVLIRPDGSFVQIARRDTWDEMFVREKLPEGL